MIDVKVKTRFIDYRVIFFANCPFQRDLAKFVQYNQCKSTSDFFGFKRERCFTKVIDLTRKAEEIFRDFKKNTRYEINRARKDGITFVIEKNMQQFVDFYNKFAESKNITQLNISYIKSYEKHLIITKAIENMVDLVMHTYLTDSQEKRVRLLNSASLFRYETDTDKKQLIGTANRLLHYSDMLFFKERGFKIYDLGGYDYQPQNERFIATNKFKDAFGGYLVEESIYTSYPLYTYRYLLNNLYRFARKGY